MDDYIDIVKELYQQTSSRVLNWQPTSVRDQYKLNIGTGKVQIDYFNEEDRQDVNGLIFRLGFLNKRDEIIEELKIYDKGDHNYHLIDNLWHEITDSYYLRKETLNSMKAALGLPET